MSKEALKAKDLRMGNYVLVKGKPTEVESIDEQGINTSVSGGYYPGETEIEYEARFGGQSFWSGHPEPAPILLSPAILLACGFIKNTENLFFLNFGGKDYTDTICMNLDSVWWWSIDCTPDTAGEDGSKWREIKYLHQLQNLIPFLTGQELTINL